MDATAKNDGCSNSDARIGYRRNIPLVTAPSTKLRFAIITDGLEVPRWAARCIGQLDRSGLATLALVIVLSPAVLPRKSKRRDWLLDKYGGWVRLRSPSLRPARNLSLLSQAEVIRCSPEIGADGFILNLLDATRVRQSGLDFIVHFSRHILRGEICDAARHGLWTFSYEDEDQQGRFPGFREVMRGDAVTSAALQRRNADGSTIDLLRGFLRTKKNYRNNTEALRLASAGWCLQLCRRIGLGQQPGAAMAAAPSPSLTEVPTSRCLIRYLARRAGNAGMEIWRKLFFLDMWNIGLVASPLRHVVTMGQAEPVSWLRQPDKLHFFADPFAAEVQGKLYILFEEFDHLRGKGWISGAALEDNLDISAHPVFTAPCHMSYPFLLEAEGKLFCVPETSEAGVILLLEASSFPNIWKKPVVIAEGFAALDSTIFAYDGKWWLFCTNAAASPEEELHAWYSEELRGPWYPHPLNPLCCDVRSARPAGSPFVLDGALMRPGQDCSRTYGGAVSIMRIDTLTPTDFRETRIGAILPNTLGPYPDGLHTIVGIGDITVIDGKRRMFSPIALPLKLLCKLRKIRRLARAKGSREIFVQELEMGARPAE
jgi:hypothetical protein